MITQSAISTQLSAAKANGLLPYFRQSARRYDLPVAVLLSVASRETGIGTNSYYLAHNYTGADGHGKGILQIDDRYHSFARMSNPGNNQANINYGAQYLADLRQQFGGDLQAALAAYNSGAANVRRAQMLNLYVDYYTTGKDYSSDVLQRAEIISEQLGFSVNTATAIIPAALALSAGAGYLYYHIVRT